MSSPNRYNIFCISDTKKCIFYAQQQKKRKKKTSCPIKNEGPEKSITFVMHMYITSFSEYVWGQILILPLRQRANFPFHVNYPATIEY